MADKVSMARVRDLVAQIKASDEPPGCGCWWKDMKGRVRARGSNLDPVCELYRRRFHRYLPLDKFMEAGRALGLTDEEALLLGQAADNEVAGEVRALVESLIR